MPPSNKLASELSLNKVVSPLPAWIPWSNSGRNQCIYGRLKAGIVRSICATIVTSVDQFTLG